MALPYVDSPPFLRALDFVTEAYLGKITGIEAELSFAGPPRANWYYSAAAEGGAMLDTMVYPLARVAALMGPAKRVTALVNRLIPHRLTGDGGRVESAVDDNVSLLLEYASGQQAQVHSIWSRSYMTNGTVLHGRHGAIFLGRYGQPLVVKSDLQAPPDGTPVEYLGSPTATPCPSRRRRGAGDRGPLPARRRGEAAAALRDRRRAARRRAAADGLRVRPAAGARSTSRTTFDLWWPREPALMDLSSDWL